MTNNDHIKAVTLGQLLDNAAQNWPDQDALIYPDVNLRYTWSEFHQEVETLARGLLALGVKRNDKVAIWATNMPQWLTFLYATAKIGAILVTVNTHYRQDELSFLLRQSETDFLVLMESFRGYNYLEALYNLAPELKNNERGNFKSPLLPHLKKVIFLGTEPQAGLYTYQEVLELARQVDISEVRSIEKTLRPEEVINIQYTSGTTGFPKGVMLSHINIATNGYWIGYHQNLTPQDRICLPVPLFHCFGLVLGNMAAINHGAAMVIFNVFSPHDILVTIQAEKCTALYGVPTMFIALLEHKSFDQFDYSSLRTGIMAGSPCPIKTMEDVINKMNMKEITICYGLTETSPVVTQTRKGDDIIKRTQTTGRAMPGVELRVVDPDSYEEKPVGEIGEVIMRGYVLMQGYYNDPESTAKMIDKDGWLHSGDLGRFDEDGYLTITGRWKDMVIRGGENIYPQEIEEYLRRMPGVIDVQVVGVTSKLHGEEVAAFIMQDPALPEITNKSVKAYLRSRISGFKIPRFVKVVEQFPMTASGKIMKFRLREMAKELWPR